MKKQFHKIKIAAENLSSRSSKPHIKSDELAGVEKHIEKYKDVLEKIYKKFAPSPGSEQEREKRMKKVHEFRLAQILEESSKELPEEFILHKVLKKCSELEKMLANYIVDYEFQTENDVTKKLKSILENDIQQIINHKRTFSRLVQECNSIKRACEVAQRSNDSNLKINQLKLELEECENKLEKERDCWAAEMFALISKDEDIASYIKNFVMIQKSFHEKALSDMETFLSDINNIVEVSSKKRVFGVELKEHLRSTNRKISQVLELCVCCLLERGLLEEGLLRVGCAGTKLKRMKNAIDAHYVTAPLPPEYQDIHVIAGLLKSYLRELPEPLLTFELYDEFISAVQKGNDKDRKKAVLNTINQLPSENYENLKYLTRFLWNLYQKHDHNKMSSHNLAIVMSPNILWPPESNLNPSDYAGQVNSSAAVNTIVELLISEWDFFFEDEVEFYQTIMRDHVFADNGEAPNIMAIDREGSETVKQTHSRSNSHDTSRILLGTGDGASFTRSQSNGSLSDSSPNQVGSPKLPARRKYNKPSAPTPPHNATSIISNNASNHPKQEYATFEQNSTQNQVDFISTTTTEPVKKCDSYSQTPSIIHAAKPEKPPRPAQIECHTLNRATYKKGSAEVLSAVSRPIALPRTLLNVAKSTENLSIPFEDSVELRGKVETREKPVIPERPITLVRPISYRNENNSTHESISGAETNNNGIVKKASSFRILNSSSQTPTTKLGGNNNFHGFTSNVNTDNVVTSDGSNHQTTLERAQIYCVDKRQVAIVDVPTSACTSKISSEKRLTSSTDNTSDIKEDDSTTLFNECITDVAPQSGRVPASPRGFDSKIKRPQVPAPPPPKNRPKSDGSTGDSTHL